jgi:hypothetical protein
VSLLKASQVAAQLGVTERCVRQWAFDGKIDGAYYLNGVWRFDGVKVSKWLEGRSWQKYTAAAKRTGAASNISAATYESRYSRLIAQKPRNDLPSGSESSAPKIQKDGRG